MGIRSGVALPPKGYEDIDAFFDAARTPSPDVNSPQEEEAEDTPNPPDLRHDSELMHKYGIQTPKNVSNWSARLLRDAMMGLSTGDSPSVLSAVSTDPRNGNVNDGVVEHDYVDVAVGDRQHTLGIKWRVDMMMSTDPPEEEMQRALDPKEEE